MNQQDPIHAAGERADPGLTAAEPGVLTGELFAERAELIAVRRELEEARQALAAATKRERSLAHELQHRVRNMLAVIRSIYRRTREIGASQDEFAEHFQGRIDAVARIYAHASGVGLPNIDLEDMLRDELLEAHCLDSPTCAISGPQVHLSGKAAEMMALAIHELVTNSIKFGALAQGGTLNVEWSLEAGEPARLRFRWTESGVSLVSSAPRPSGFGRQLIEEALPYQLGATTWFDLRPGGVECSMLLPLPEPDEISRDQGATVATSLLLQAEAEQMG